MLDFIKEFFFPEKIRLADHRASVNRIVADFDAIILGIKSSLDLSEAKVAELNNTVEDFRSVNKNLQTNIATYRTERDKSYARVDAAIKALQA